MFRLFPSSKSRSAAQHDHSPLSLCHRPRVIIRWLYDLVSAVSFDSNYMIFRNRDECSPSFCTQFPSLTPPTTAMPAVTGAVANTQCGVCMDDFTDPVTLPCCPSMIYCRNCLDMWLANRPECPHHNTPADITIVSTLHYSSTFMNHCQAVSVDNLDEVLAAAEALHQRSAVAAARDYVGLYTITPILYL